MSTATPETMYVITTLHGGGAERLLTNILLPQAASHRISVVSLLPGGVFRPQLERAGIPVADLGMTRRRDALRGVFRLAALIRATRPAVVHGWMYHANLLVLAALLLAGPSDTRLFWGIFCTDFGDSPLHWTFRVVRRASALLSRRADGIVYNAVEARDFHHAIGFHEQRSIVISNCIDTEVFRHNPAQRNALRAELGITGDELIVCIVARVDPMKDWRTMCDAVRDLPGIVTVAVGKGTDELAPQTGFVGLGWRDDVVRILSGSDLFFLGSAYGEGASLALGEAMSCGLPCVVTDVGGNAAMVADGGIVVEPGNAAAMRAAILELAANRDLRETLGRAARARAAASATQADAVSRLHVRSLTGEARA